MTENSGKMMRDEITGPGDTEERGGAKVTGEAKGTMTRLPDRKSGDGQSHSNFGLPGRFRLKLPHQNYKRMTMSPLHHLDRVVCVSLPASSRVTLSKRIPLVIIKGLQLWLE